MGNLKINNLLNRSINQLTNLEYQLLYKSIQLLRRPPVMKTIYLNIFVLSELLDATPEKITNAFKELANKQAIIKDSQDNKSISIFNWFLYLFYNAETITETFNVELIKYLLEPKCNFLTYNLKSKDAQ